MTVNLKDKLNNLPETPGVYIFKNKLGEILYIGKATSLRDRVRSYFSGAHENRIENMVSQIADVEYRETDSVLEALILESHLIKKYQPKYNIKDKDDKSFVYAVITKDDFPQVIILRKTDLGENQKLKIKNKNDNVKIKNKQVENLKIKEFFGPYTSKRQLEIALKIIRRIFPYHSLPQKTEKGCLDFQLGRCPGPYALAITKEDYLKNIRGISMILEGKKKGLIRKMEKEMREYAKQKEFEKAAGTRNKLFALKHIQDVALLVRDDNFQFPISNFQNLRIEAYDISNISGEYATGSMAVFEGDKPNKSEYRKFKIKTISESDDVGMMREVLQRRFGNPWKKPDLILLDGGEGHLNMAQKVLCNFKLDISIAAIAKGPERKEQKVIIGEKVASLATRRGGGNKELSRLIGDPPKRREEREIYGNYRVDIENILNNKTLLKHIMDEAHRFAISYHRKLRDNLSSRPLQT